MSSLDAIDETNAKELKAVARAYEQSNGCPWNTRHGDRHSGCCVGSVALAKVESYVVGSSVPSTVTVTATSNSASSRLTSTYMQLPSRRAPLPRRFGPP